MTARLLFMIALLFGLSACAGEAPEATETAQAPSGPPFLALHLYNPASDEAHQQFLGFLAELNGAVAGTGLADTRYRVWKVTGDQAGDYGYLFGSLWADRANYDAVHDHDAYKAVWTRFEETGLEPFQAEVYNRYVLLNPAPGETPPMPEAGPAYMSMHLLNLDAAGEQALLAILEDANAAVASAGHPETWYGLWKIAENQAGDYGYLFGSLWADRATYDAVHEHPDFTAFAERHGSAYEALVAGEVYNRYERVRVE